MNKNLGGHRFYECQFGGVFLDIGFWSRLPTFHLEMAQSQISLTKTSFPLPIPLILLSYHTFDGVVSVTIK